MPDLTVDLSLKDIQAARVRIAGVARCTPTEPSIWLSRLTGVPVYLKLECWQRTRSFKLRGAFNAVAALSPAALPAGLVAASAGNHGQAVALAAREAGARATIFVPATAPAVKKDRIRAYGAELRDHSPDYDAAEAEARRFAAETGATLIHAFSDRAVVAGQGTIGLEILEAVPDVEQIVVPMGGGGLAAGIGVAVRSAAPAVRLSGVQSSETRAMYDAFAAGRVVDSPITPTLADGLAGCTDEISYGRVRQLVDELQLVEESALPHTIRSLYRYDGIVAEGAAAVVAAAMIERVIEASGPTVLVITGGNIDARQLGAILSAC